MMIPEVAAALSEESSPLHDKCRDFARKRIEHAERRWADRHEPWKENEQLYRAFRVPDKQDQLTRSKQLTEGVEKIVVPYSYAVLQSTLAFFMTVFTQRVPMIPVAGAGPGDVRAAIFHELLLDYQLETMRPTGVLLLYQWLFDALRYGIGIVKNAWTIREWPDLIRQVTPKLDEFTGQVIGQDDVIIERDVIAYEGNEGMNVSPFHFLPDPSRSYGEFQEGEFVDHRLRRSWTQMRQRQAQGLYVGIDFIPAHMAGSTEYGHGGSQSDLSRITQMSETDMGSMDADNKPYVTLDELWVFCDPGRDLGIPGVVDGATPKLWVITLANKARVVRVEAANLPGRRFPFEVIEPNYDLHSPANVSQIEVFRGLQYHYSWLFNSRMQCFDPATEMLTDQGWVPVAEITDGHQVATVDPETRALWYERPAAVMAYDYDGPMVRIDTMRADLCVTPNHRLFVAKRTNTGPTGYAPYGFVEAGQLASGEYRLPIGGLADDDGIDGGERVFDAEPPIRDRGRPPRYPERRVSLETWAAFLGWMVSDGSVSKGSASGTHACTIAQKKPQFIPAIAAMMADMPWPHTRHESDDGTVHWTIADRRLYRYLAEHVGTSADTKRVPSTIFAYSKRLRSIFLQAALAGDGTLNRDGEPRAFTSVSKTLADGIQRVALSIGWMAYGGMRPGTDARPVYSLNLSPDIADHGMATSRNVRMEPSVGRVYCVENSTHLVVVRRNGKVCITGQSVRKTLNNQMVVDPSMIDEADLLSDDPGLLLRLKRQHWQAGAVREAVFPLPVQDVTQGHISVDAPMVREMIDLISGANNLIMGVANTGRRSATEVQGQLQLASGRMKMLIELVSRQGVMPWAKQMVRNNQTFLDGQTLRLREPYANLFGQPMIDVTPEMLQGEFTIPIGENGIPTDRQLEGNLWKEMIQMGMQSGTAVPIPPQFWQVAFSRFLWANGVKDIQAAGLTMQNLTVSPDEAVQGQVQQGNLVPGASGAVGEAPMSSDGFPMPPSAGVPGVGNNGLNA